MSKQKTKSVEELTKGFEDLANKKGLVKDNKAAFNKTLEKAMQPKNSKGK